MENRIIAAFLAVDNLWIKGNQKILSDERKEAIQQALLERVSLSGICRKVSMTWLSEFMEEIFRTFSSNS